MTDFRDDGQLKLEVPYQEMLDHLNSRKTHHQERSADYSAKADAEEKRLDEELGRAETVTDRMHIKASNTYSSTVSLRDQLRTKVREHAVSARFFEFCASHLAKQDVFRLTQDMLVALEFFPRRSW